MALDPVHLDGIARLVRRVSRDVDETEHRDLADAVWTQYLDPLYDDGTAILEPVDEQCRYRAPVEDLGLQRDAFAPVHGLDSGTINPRTFTNGLTLDVAQAAMSASPSDLDLHRSRTIVTAVHSNDATVDPSADWAHFDERFVRGQAIQVPDLAREATRAAHWLALYLAESEHALRHAEAVESLLVLDGPLYPKEVVSWASGDGDLSGLAARYDVVGSVVENYRRLVETFVERDVPLVGFVKSGASGALVRALRGKTVTPWANDMALFTQVLEPAVTDGNGGRRQDELAWTNWFVSRLGADGAFAALARERADESDLDPAAYEVAFFVVYDPRTDLAYKAELPRAFAEDPAVRERVQHQILREVAAERGPPLAVQKADALARIGRQETASLVEKLEAVLESRRDRNYDDERWGGRVDGQGAGR